MSQSDDYEQLRLFDPDTVETLPRSAAEQEGSDQ